MEAAGSVCQNSDEGRRSKGGTRGRAGGMHVHDSGWGHLGMNGHINKSRKLAQACCFMTKGVFFGLPESYRQQWSDKGTMICRI